MLRQSRTMQEEQRRISKTGGIVLWTRMHQKHTLALALVAFPAGLFLGFFIAISSSSSPSPLPLTPTAPPPFPAPSPPFSSDDEDDGGRDGD